MLISAPSSPALAKSQVWATAPEPMRLRPGEEPPPSEQEKAIQKRARALVLEWEKREKGWTYGMVQLQEEFGFEDPYRARQEISGAWVTLAIERGIVSQSGGVPGVSAPMPFQGFASINEAKSFAQAKLMELKQGLQQYNLGVSLWNASAVKARREEMWTLRYQGVLQATGDEQKAIKSADTLLAFLIDTDGRMNDAPLRSGIGGLESAFRLSGPLTRENPDGTWSLNDVTVRDFAGNLILEIGSPQGQTIDKTA